MTPLELLEIITKIGIFFLIAYLNGILVSALSLWMNLRRSVSGEWSPLTHLPLSSGIVFPIVSTVLLVFPLGFTRNTQRPFLDEVDSYPIRFVALFVHLFLHFALLSILAFYPAILIWSDWLFLYFLMIHLLFILFNLLPFYPSVMSFLILSWIHRRFSKKYDSSAAYQVMLSYKAFSLVLLILFLMAGFHSLALKKIQIHLTLFSSLKPGSLLGISGVLFSVLVLILGLYRFHIFKYHEGIKKMFQDLFREREEEEKKL